MPDNRRTRRQNRYKEIDVRSYKNWYQERLRGIKNESNEESILKWIECIESDQRISVNTVKVKRASESSLRLKWDENAINELM